MSQLPPPSETPVPIGDGVHAVPLHPTDPPRIGDFWLDARLVATPSGVAYLAHGGGRQVMLLTLDAGGAGDAGARQRFAGEVNQLHVDTVVARGGQGQDEGRFAHRFRDTGDQPVDPSHTPVAPWTALAYDGSPAAVAEAKRLLHGVDLSLSSYLGQPSGPDYQLHWMDDQQPGAWRVWPLPWPGRADRAGWMTILVSWLLMIVTAALALLIAVLLFQNTPPAPPPPPLPTNQTPPPSSSSSASPPPSSSASPSPSSGSPSPSSGSASPTPSSASPTPSSSGSPSPSSSPTSSGEPTHSGKPSMNSPQPSGSASGQGGEPTPNKRL